MTLSSATADSEVRREREPLVQSHPYHPRDFTYYEDRERRWTGVAIYGTILILVAALLRGQGYVPVIGLGVAMAAFGVMVIVIVAGVLLVLLWGEAAIGAIAAGLTLFVAGMTVLAGANTDWPLTILGLEAIGGACLVIGAGAAIRYWKLSNANVD
jgi:hypothetical protein